MSFRRSRINDRCLNDVSFRGTADKIEWVTSYERQRRVQTGLEHRHIARVNDGDAIDDIGHSPSRRIQFDCVPHADVLQSAEKAVAMSRDGRVAAPSGSCRACHVADSPVQGQFVGTFEDGNFYANLGYSEDGNCGCEMCRQALPVAFNALLRPQTDVRSRAGLSGPTGLLRLRRLLMIELLQGRVNEDGLVKLGGKVKGQHQEPEDQKQP